MRLLLSTLFAASIMSLPVMAENPNTDRVKALMTQQVATYGQIVYASYKDTYDTAKILQAAVDAFLANPSEATLNAAKEAWVSARQPYLQTEAYRFYEGPIDVMGEKQGEEGPEARINSWPLNEAYIDYVKGNPKAGIVNDPSVALTRDTLAGKNQEKDEADVATGYHAIEFLLWGQDLHVDGPGRRPASDYTPGVGNNDRRRAYLKLVTDLLVDDLGTLVTAWEPGKDNYAKQFANESPEIAMTRIMTGMATLSGFELASERLATALDGGDQEDEHSCFSDTTTQDFIYNQQGISNLYFGTYGSVKGVGLYDVVKAKDAKLANRIAAKIKKAQGLLGALPTPFDTGVLAAAEDSPARHHAEDAVIALQEQAELLQKAGKALGLEVTIVTE